MFCLLGRIPVITVDAANRQPDEFHGQLSMDGADALLGLVVTKTPA